MAAKTTAPAAFRGGRSRSGGAESPGDGLSRSRAAALMVQELIARIRAGELQPGSLIMSGPALSKRYGISYQTVVRALGELVERGWLVRQHGRGTFVAPHPPGEDAVKAARNKTVLLALDPRSLTRGRFGFAIVEALDEALVREGLRVRYAPVSAAGEAVVLEELSAGEGDLNLLIAFDRPAFLKRALAKSPGLSALALHAVPESPAPGGSLRYDAVLVEDHAGGFMAGAYLLKHGYKRIAFLGGPQDDLRAQDRFAGLKEALAADDLKPAAEAWADGWDEQTGRIHARALLKKLGLEKSARSAEAPAVFCGNDRLAHGLYDAADELMLQIPRDLSVIGFDDQEIAAQLKPPLTTVRFDRSEYGRQAAQLVKERLAEPNRPPRVVRMPVQIVERESVK
ncbi:MAG: GntR family transcriptional regulator [Planctomycetes bacterium]|nr:GntR family transcriptional regulator [Planctomycetota bacterium]